MKTVRVATAVAYDVRIGPGLLAGAHEAVRGRSACAVVSDKKVTRLYKSSVGTLADSPWFELEPGEDSKSFATLERVLDFQSRSRLDRRSTLIAFGGGVVGDVGGMAAALYMRGIQYVQVPTTLLAQVDSSVGGKTAVNLAAGKNLAGVFHQPSLVIADTSTLATLSDDEFRSGLGEVIKTALLTGADALALLERDASRIWSRDPSALETVVEMCVRTKAAIVSRDPHEKGPRKLLNLGHTFAHAIEHEAGYGKVPHGVAVGVGLCLALATSQRTQRLADPELPARVDALLAAFGMPRSLAALTGVKLDPARLVSAMSLDKKNAAGKLRLVLPVSAGDAIFDVEVDEPSLLATLRAPHSA
ncbi:MAG: 3-dehydroquinate synthase [Planctomycetes bacterium]|nr:3-dehydroquinate synthase [Planctomycetota bacterium]